MPPLSPQPSTCVLHGGTAFAPSTMGRSRGGGLGGLVKPKAKVVVYLPRLSWASSALAAC